MHPDLLRALAQARHHDLLDASRTRRQPKARLRGRGSLSSRSRHRLGALFIRTGVRLVGDRQAEVELAN